MQNSPNQATSHPGNRGRTIREMFVSSFEPVLIRRPMYLFGASISLQPGTATKPSPEFLVHVLTGYESHEALLRHLAGHEFENLSHILRKQGSIRKQTWDDVTVKTGLSKENLLKMSHGNKGGDLLPEVLGVIQVMQGLPTWIYNLVTDHTLNCPGCGGNFFNDMDISWTKQSILLGKPEYELVEKILTATLGGFLFLASVSNKKFSASPIEILLPLVNSGGHPIGNWLKTVWMAYGVKSLIDLESQLFRHKVIDSKDKMVTARRLADWARGTHLLSFENADRIIKPLASREELKYTFTAARAFAFVEEFVIAAHNGDVAPAKLVVRTVIKKRLEDLNAKLLLGLRITLGKTSIRSEMQISKINA